MLRKLRLRGPAKTAVSKSPNNIGGKAAVLFPWLSPLSLRLLRIGTRHAETKYSNLFC
jgi:hypothetical protein